MVLNSTTDAATSSSVRITRQCLCHRCCCVLPLTIAAGTGILAFIITVVICLARTSKPGKDRAPRDVQAGELDVVTAPSGGITQLLVQPRGDHILRLDELDNALGFLHRHRGHVHSRRRHLEGVIW